MSRAADLPTGIDRTANGRFRVGVRIAPNSNKRAYRTFTDEISARDAHVRGLEALRDGGDVQAALDAVVDGRPLQRQILPSQIPLLNEALARHLAVRAQRSKVSNHKRRSSPKKGVIGMRPGSLRSLEDKIALLDKHLGDHRLNELTSDVLETFVAKMASPTATTKGGYSVATVNGLIITLRAVVGRAEESHRPSAFPWRDVAPIAPSCPRRPAVDPTKWGGAPGSSIPFMPLSTLLKLAHRMWAADRIVLYMEYLGGPRIGETFGLQYKHLKFRDGRLWVTIEQQLDDTSTLLPWTKSDAGYRTIPLAGILAEYLVAYCLRYGNYDLHNPDPGRADEFVVRNSAGRDRDGTFLPGRRSPFSSRFTTTRDSAGFGHDVLGYEFTPHVARKFCSTMLLRATSLLYDIQRHCADIGAPSLAPPIAFQPIDISAYLGHEHDGQGDQCPASEVTIDYYNASLLDDVAPTSIADVIDYIARDRIGTLLDQPDENDCLPVHPLDDPIWMTATEAARELRLCKSNVMQAIHSGRLDGHKGWLADGGWRRNADSAKTLPALPQYFVRCDSVRRYQQWQRALSLNDAAARLGMTPGGFQNTFVNTGLIEIVGGRIDPDDLDKLIWKLRRRLLALLRDHGPLTPRAVQRLFRAHNSELFGDNPRWQLSWYSTWLDQLVATRTVRRRADGTYAARQIDAPATGAPSAA